MRFGFGSLVPVALVSSAAAALDAAMQATLDKHNVYRCMHGLPDFTWDDAVAAKAQQWASNGQFAHSTNAFRTVDGVQWGENLAAGGAYKNNGAEAVQDWYKEIKYTSPWGTCDSDTDHSGDTSQYQMILHYTQLVWKDTTKLGCGVNGGLWVCMYSSAGNWAGQYKEKVPAPVKNYGDCGGVKADVPANTPEAGAQPPGGGAADVARPAATMAVALVPLVLLLAVLGA